MLTSTDEPCCVVLRCSAKLSSLASVGGGSGPSRLLVSSILDGVDAVRLLGRFHVLSLRLFFPPVTVF